MQYVLLIYQPSTPRSSGEQTWVIPSGDEKKAIGAEYAAINQAPGVTPGLPLGLPQNATTVRVKDGKTLTSAGPYVDVKGSVAGYYVIQADQLDTAIETASRIPATRLGGAVEVRPVGTYW
jgi:hypothetical protein